MNLLKRTLENLPASFVVFLVALPLSLGIALASGAPVSAGLIAAAIGGIIVGIAGGAPLQVSGPAAGLTVMVYTLIQSHGIEGLAIITLIAGILQIALGWAGTAQYALAISPAVLHAMLAGIGILIALAQTHVLLGGVPHGSAIQNILTLPQSILNVNASAFAPGILALAILIVWKRWSPKSMKAIPGSLIAVVAGTLVSFLIPGEIPRVKLGADFLTLPHLPALSGLAWHSLVGGALGLTLVASAESLLCAMATDQLHSGPRANLNRELFAQGLGNSLSALLGGLPITGVIVRSSANISAGANSRISAILHGVWILVFAAFFSPMINLIPLSVLAGLLVHVGTNLVKIAEIRELRHFRSASVYAVTLAGVVLLNLLWGIGLGFALSLILLLRDLARINVQFTESKDGSIHVTFRGSLSFLSVPVLTQQLRGIPQARQVSLTFQVERLDHAAIVAIRDWKKGYQRTGGEVTKEPLEMLWRELAKA